MATADEEKYAVITELKSKYDRNNSKLKQVRLKAVEHLHRRRLSFFWNRLFISRSWKHKDGTMKWILDDLRSQQPI